MDNTPNRTYNASLEQAEREAGDRLLNEALRRIQLLEKRADKAATVIADVLRTLDTVIKQ